MKKFIFLILLLFSVTIFAEKLTTNGQDNFDKIKGYWDSNTAEIYKNGNDWYIESPGHFITKFERYKPGIFKLVVKDDFGKYLYTEYIAWDTKYKTIVSIDKNLNIEEKWERKVKCVRNNTCN